METGDLFFFWCVLALTGGAVLVICHMCVMCGFWGRGGRFEHFWGEGEKERVREMLVVEYCGVNQSGIHSSFVMQRGTESKKRTKQKEMLQGVEGGESEGEKQPKELWREPWAIYCRSPF